MSAKWTTEQIPDQTGRTAIVTGANSGLGLASARELARKGANVVLACRNAEKGAIALEAIARDAPGAQLELAALDLGSLASVKAFAERFRSTHDGLDLLLNNAGVMAPPRRVTADGFELQLGTNHLGHFALMGHLIGTMQGRDDARVVTLSSNAHKMGRIDFDDLQSERRYSRWRAYGQSKLADLMSRTGARSTPARIRLDGQEPRGSPGLCGHQPAVRRGTHRRSPRNGGDATRWSRRAPIAVPCPRCTPPPSPALKAASTWGPTGSASSAAIRGRCHPVAQRVTSRLPPGYGRSPKS